MVLDLIESIVLTTWLVALTYSDLRTRSVPVWATAVPLVLLGLTRAVIIPPDGRIWPGGVAVGFALLMVLLSDTPSVVFPAGAALFCAGLSGPATRVLVGSWFLALVLAAVNIWGAGDGKVFVVLMALFPAVELLVTLGVALVVGSVITLLYRRRRATSQVSTKALRAALRLPFPNRTGERGTLPAVPWLALGTALYLVTNGVWG